MANYEVIADVSATLRATLKVAMESSVTSTGDPDLSLSDVAVEFLDVDLPPSTKMLTLFLFEVGEDPTARNHARVRETDPPDFKIRKPPMALLLRYLLTPWGGDQPTQQKILGRTLQALYDKPVFSGIDLQGVLQNTDEMLKVTLSPLSLEDRTRVWHSVQKPYRLSVAYEVRVVNLDATEAVSVTPVTRRTAEMEGLEGGG